MPTAASDSTAPPDAPGPLVLVPGYWLGAWAWDDVVAELAASGRTALALTLPGLAPAGRAERAAVTLADQVEAVVAVLRQHPGATLVGHSGAGPVVQLAADAVPELVARLVWVDSGPATGGPREGPPAGVAELPLPTWGELAEGGNSLEGMDDAQLATFRERAVPQPAATARDEVSARGAWAGLPCTVVCTSLPSEVLREMVAGGHPVVAALDLVPDLQLVDLPTGHWAMWSRPADLARVLAAL